MRLLFLALAASLPAAGAADEFGTLRGANYVPSYSPNDVQTWADFDADVVSRELGYAERLKLNCVRVFLQFAVYEQNPERFLAHFESFLGLCEQHRIRMMPVLFDSCFGDFPDLAGYRDKDWMANPGQNRISPDHWPALERYVRGVVGRHKEDRRILMWDVMNEPTCTRFNAPEDQKAIWAFLDHFLDYVRQQDPRHPRTVGVESSALIGRIADKVDVLCFHNYTQGLRDDIRGVKELAAQHGKPAIINEVVMRPQQPFSFAMPVLRAERIGWVFWELMLGRTQFSRGMSPIQGVLYPDGTCRDAREVAAVMDITEQEARRLFPERPKPRAEEDGIAFAGYWTRWTGRGPHKDRLFYSNSAGDTATWTAEGDTITLVHKVGPDCGIARVLIDGRPAADPSLDTYSPDVEWNHRTVLAAGLPRGRHIIVLEVAGAKHPKSSNTYVQVVGAE